MKRFTSIFFLCLIGLTALFACGYSEQVTREAIYIRISGEEAYKMMQETDDFVLLDVRSLDEFYESRIEGAILIPYDEIADRALNELPDTDKLILIYCRTGRRSAVAANVLIAMGYTNVYDFGGIETDWEFEVVGER